MIEIRVKSDRDPKVLADLIAQTHDVHTENDKVRKDVHEAREELSREHPSRQEIETVNFQRLDTDNDWTDV
jgi:hypothetical protein